MKYILASQRSKAILGIVMIAIGIGTISKTVIKFPAFDCMKGEKELTLKTEMKRT